MKREELKSLCDELIGFATPESQGRISEIILTLSEQNELSLNELAEMKSSNDTLNQSVKALQNANTKLLMKVGEVPTEEKPPEGTPKTPMKFEDLFNEKGELK